MAPITTSQMGKHEPPHHDSDSLASSPDQRATHWDMAESCSSSSDGSSSSGRSSPDEEDDSDSAEEDGKPAQQLIEEQPQLPQQLQQPTTCRSPGLSDGLNKLKMTNGPAFRNHRTAKPYKIKSASDDDEESSDIQPSREHQPKLPGTQANAGVASDGVNYQQVHSKLVYYISCVLELGKYAAFDCIKDAEKLARVTIVMTKNHELYNFLGTFSHSVSCTKPDCTISCRMFKRIRSHVATASHPCAVMHVYGQILRLHVDTCVRENCGLVTCKSMLAIRVADGHRVLPREFQQKELAIAYSLRGNARPVTLLSRQNSDDTASFCNKENIPVPASVKDIKPACEYTLVKKEVDTTAIVQQQALNLSKNKEDCKEGVMECSENVKEEMITKHPALVKQECDKLMEYSAIDLSNTCSQPSDGPAQSVPVQVHS